MKTTQPRGFDKFTEVLRNLAKVSKLALGAGLAAPFAAAFVDIAPPWPRGVLFMTTLVEFLVLVCAFQFFPSLTRKRTNRIMAISLAFLVILVLTYLYLFSRYTYEVPSNQPRQAKGLVYTEEARLVLGRQTLTGDEALLRSAEYKASRIWKEWSIDLVLLMLLLLWCLAFSTMAFFLSVFVLFQTKSVVRSKS